MDTLFLGGRVLTMDRTRPRAEAVAVRGGKIAAVGSSQEISRHEGPETRVVLLNGRALMPGFVDAHTHFYISVLDPVTVNCASPPYDTIGDVLSAIRAAASSVPTGRWIFAFGFRRRNIRDDRPLTRWELDEVAPQNPVCVMDGLIHPAYANSMALGLAGITRDTPDPRRGLIVRDGRGEPTGELLEGAADAVYTPSFRALLDLYGDRMADLVHDCALRHLSYGITSVGDAAVFPDVAKMYRDADSQKKLPLTLHQMMVGNGFFGPPEEVSQGQRDAGNVSDRLRGGTIKVFMDPVFPSPAYMRRHADGHVECTGTRNYTQEEIDALVLRAHKRGLRVAIHCLGNWAIEQALNAFERALREHPVAEPRFRIEHGSMPELQQVRRAASLGVIASMQPSFVYNTTSAYLERVAAMGGQLLVHPYRTMLEAGVAIAASSDSPYTPLDPLVGIYALVTRMTRSGFGPVVPEEAIAVEDALRMYTMGSAYAMDRDSEVGSIEVGKRADLVVLSHDPTAVAPDALRQVVVEQTYVDGTLAYQGPAPLHPF